uniref:DH domain-containing protein n=1 Tax=Heterorhabditis bacteriophora TaxID=37862 RepID=A0A1I7XC03_HETBA
MSQISHEFEFCTTRSTIDTHMNDNKSVKNRELCEFPLWVVPYSELESQEYINIKQELYDSERNYLNYLLVLQKLKSVLKEMSEITGLIESCISDFENGEKLWTIQELLGLKEDIVAPGRRFIKEGSLYKVEVTVEKLRTMSVYFGYLTTFWYMGKDDWVWVLDTSVHVYFPCDTVFSTII